ncbi:MAG: Crp/Fnr family transcriptional regulator [Lachnospiraceae bacterium]
MKYCQKNLFYQISSEEFQTIKSCLFAVSRHFDAGETACTFDEDDNSIGVISKGSLSIIRYEINGNRTILECLGEKDIFGTAISVRTAFQEDIAAICDSDCEILFFDYARLVSPCTKACRHHLQLIENLLSIFAEKTLFLRERVEVLSKRSIREKLLSYFFQLSAKSGSLSFQLPLSMIDLADYLSVDRSAMTRELKKMKEEQLLSMEKRSITLHPGPLSKTYHYPASKHKLQQTDHQK